MRHPRPRDAPRAARAGARSRAEVACRGGGAPSPRARRPPAGRGRRPPAPTSAERASARRRGARRRRGRSGRNARTRPARSRAAIPSWVRARPRVRPVVGAVAREADPDERAALRGADPLERHAGAELAADPLAPDEPRPEREPLRAVEGHLEGAGAPRRPARRRHAPEVERSTVSRRRTRRRRAGRRPASAIRSSVAPLRPLPGDEERGEHRDEVPRRPEEVEGVGLRLDPERDELERPLRDRERRDGGGGERQRGGRGVEPAPVAS